MEDEGKPENSETASDLVEEMHQGTESVFITQDTDLVQENFEYFSNIEAPIFNPKDAEFDFSTYAGDDESNVQELIQCNCEEMKPSGITFRYSIMELQSLRFLGGKQQQDLMWKEAYFGMGSVRAQEYDDLAAAADINTEEQCSQNNMDYDQHVTKRKRKGASCPEKKKKRNASGYVEKVVETRSDDEYDSIRRPAFFVEGEPDFDSGPPQDGLEFLRRVRWEAKRIPNVTVVKLDEGIIKSEQTVYMPVIADIAECPEHLLPTKQWEDVFLNDFSELRQSLMDPDTLGDVQKSEYFKMFVNINNDGDSSSGPKLSQLVGMDVVSRAATLRNRIKLLEDKDTLSRRDCAWLYGLCAVVDVPFGADMGASLRCLLRKCAKLRSQKMDSDDEVVMLNILVTLSGRFFGQLEK